MPDNNEQKFEWEQAVMGAPADAACAPETVVPIPDELKEPKGESNVTPKPELPDYIPVWNFEQKAICSEPGSIGDDVVVEDGAVSSTVHFTDVLSIPNDVLHTIAKRKLEKNIGELFHREVLTEKVLHKLTGMKMAHAKELIKVLMREQQLVDEAARLYAESLLECYWENKPQTVQCTDESVVHEGTYGNETAVFSYEIEKGIVKSPYSQEDADNKAMELAESMLNCFYVNEEVEALCEESPTRPMDVMEPVPNDTEPIYPGRDLRVGSVVVAAGQFLSHMSQEDANDQALAYGYSQLVCWYPNMEITVDCDDPNARGPYMDPLETDAVDADIIEKTPGQHVRIPAGFFTSEISYEEATRLAEEYAQTLLECCFINDEIYIACEEETVVTYDGRIVTIPPHESSPMIEVRIPRGTYTSCYSQREADDIATQNSEGLLSCRYCNVGIPPACVPDWVIEGIKAGELTLPLEAGRICYNGECMDSSELPFGATQGIDDCVVFSDDAQMAQEIANAMSRMPITKNDGDESLYNCTYYNNKLVLACASSDPYATDETLQENAGITPEGEEYYFVSLYPPGTCVAESISIPTGNNVLIIPAGLWQGKGHEIKEELNARAYAYAMSIMQCFFGNPEVEAVCSSESSFGGFCDEKWIYGKNPTYDPSRLTPWSPSPEEQFILPKDFILYRGKGDDLDDAVEQVQSNVISYLTGRLTCTYTNESKQGHCNPDMRSTERDLACYTGDYEVNVTFVDFSMHDCSGGFVIEGMIVAESPDEADARAMEMADRIMSRDTDSFTIYCKPECSSSSSSSSSDPDRPPDPPWYWGYGSSSSWSSSCSIPIPGIDSSSSWNTEGSSSSFVAVIPGGGGGEASGSGAGSSLSSGRSLSNVSTSSSRSGSSLSGSNPASLSGSGSGSGSGSLSGSGSDDGRGSLSISGSAGGEGIGSGSNGIENLGSGSGSGSSSYVATTQSRSYSFDINDACGWWNCLNYIIQSEYDSQKTQDTAPQNPTTNTTQTTSWTNELEIEYVALTKELEDLTKEVKALL